MRVYIRKIKNISKALIPLEVADGEMIYLEPGEIIENVVIRNLNTIRSYVSLEEDLGEVGTAEGKMYLKG